MVFWLRVSMKCTFFCRLTRRTSKTDEGCLGVLSRERTGEGAPLHLTSPDLLFPTPILPGDHRREGLVITLSNDANDEYGE